MNRFYSTLEFVWVGEKLVCVDAQGFNYDDTVALCKGDDVAKKQEADQAAFNTQLMASYQTQFSKQGAILDFLKGKLQPMIDHPTGYTPEALAAMRTSASDNLSTSYDNANKALQNRQFAAGGRDLPSGVNAQISGSLAQAEASDKAAAQNTVTLNDENLKESNYWNAMNVLSGNVAGQYNPIGYANSVSSGSNAVAGLSQAVTASNQSQLLGALGGIAGGVGSAFAGTGFAKNLGCWMAAATFDGWEDARTGCVRSYLWNTFSKTPIGAVVMALYMKYGERASQSPLLVNLFRPAFHLALAQATC